MWSKGNHPRLVKLHGFYHPSSLQHDWFGQDSYVNWDGLECEHFRRIIFQMGFSTTYQKINFWAWMCRPLCGWERERKRDQPYLGKDLWHLDFLISPKQPVSTQLWVWNPHLACLFASKMILSLINFFLPSQLLKERSFLESAFYEDIKNKRDSTLGC